MDIATIKQRQQAAWAAGDAAAVGTRLLLTAELPREAVDLRASDDAALVLRQDYLEAIIHEPATP
jgi:hypothetical protein